MLGWIVEVAQVLTAVAALLAVSLTWRAMGQERERYQAGVRQARADRRSDELTHLYESVLEVSAEIVGMLALARNAGYVNRREASALMAKIHHAGALIRLRGGDQEVIDEFACLADLALDSCPSWTSLLAGKLGGRRTAGDPNMDRLQEQLMRAADAACDALARAANTAD